MISVTMAYLSKNIRRRISVYQKKKKNCDVMRSSKVANNGINTYTLKWYIHSRKLLLVSPDSNGFINMHSERGPMFSWKVFR